MKTISLSNIFRLYFYTHKGFCYNRVNLNFQKQYRLFFEKNAPQLSYEEFLMRPLSLNDYSDEYLECEKFIKEVVLSATTQEIIKQLNFTDFDDCIDVANEILVKKSDVYKDEEFELSDEDFQKMRTFFVNGIKLVHQRYAFTIKRNEVLNKLPEECHQPFLDLHRKLNGKRLTGNPTPSFMVLRDFFDVDDNEWLEENKYSFQNPNKE